MQEALKDEKNEYIFFSDQDDVWENNKVSVMLHRMKECWRRGMGKQCPILLYSDMEVVDEELYEISPSFAAYTHQDPDRNSFAELLVENQVTGGSLHDQPGTARALCEEAGNLLYARLVDGSYRILLWRD